MLTKSHYFTRTIQHWTVWELGGSVVTQWLMNSWPATPNWRTSCRGNFLVCACIVHSILCNMLYFSVPCLFCWYPFIGYLHASTYTVFSFKIHYLLFFWTVFYFTCMCIWKIICRLWLRGSKKAVQCICILYIDSYD